MGGCVFAIGVVDVLTGGVKIVETLPRIGIWRPQDRSAQCSKEVVWANAPAAQRQVMQCSDVTEDDLELWKATMEERDAGGLIGPFSFEQMVGRLGPNFVPARRFPLRQGGKLRPIDDFSAPMTNSAFGTEEKVLMKGIEQVVSYSRAWWESVDDSGYFSVEDTSGKRWEGWLNEEWDVDHWRDLCGRVADLKGAYKQLAVHPDHKTFSVIGVLNPEVA